MSKSKEIYKKMLKHNVSFRRAMEMSSSGSPVPPPIEPVTWGDLKNKGITWGALNTRGITWKQLKEGVEL